MEMCLSLLVLASALSLAKSFPMSPNDIAAGMENSNKAHESAIILPFRVESDQKRKSTANLLKHIGMEKVHNVGNHHRKRLASQSRKSHSADSHMYIIKLPHNPYYYDAEMTRNAQLSRLNRVPIDFKSNGKPAKIYHWNLPEIKKMVARRANAKSNDANDVFKPTIWTDEQPTRRVSYYKPKKPSKQAFQKYFPGNGRPSAIYVIESKHRTPTVYNMKV